MADTTYYPFRLTETVLTDSDFGFGSGVFGGWISDLENGVNGAVVVYKWTQAYHTDTVNPGESMKHEFDYSESIEVEDSTKQEFEAKPNESLTVWEYDQNYLDRLGNTLPFLLTSVVLTDSDYGFGCGSFGGYYPTTIVGTSETKPTASGTSETKPRASGIGIKDVDD